MSNFKSNIFFTIVIIILILLMTSVNIYFYYKKNSGLIFYDEFEHKFINYENETTEDFLKIFYIYNKSECEQCIVEHLKLMNHIIDNMNNSYQFRVFVIGHDRLSYYNFLKYKKIFNLKIHYLEFDELIFNIENIELRSPIIILVDENNKIINAWKADIIKLSKTKEILKNKLKIN